MTETSGELVRTTTFAYDHRGLLTSVTTPDPDPDSPAVGPLTTSYQYDLLGRQTVVRAPDGVETRYEYSDAGDLISETVWTPDGGGYSLARTTVYTYDAAGRVTEVTAPDGTKTSTTYDDLGNVRTVTFPDPDGPDGPLPSPTTTYTYDPTGRFLLETADVLGRITRYTYDEVGQLLSMAAPDPDVIGGLNGPVTQYRYDQVGNRTHVIDPNGNLTTWEYDNLYRVLSVGESDELENASATSVDSPPSPLGMQVVDLRLYRDTGTPGDNITTMPLLMGQVTGSADLASTTIHVDIDNDGSADTTAAPSATGSFVVDLTSLVSFGPVVAQVWASNSSNSDVTGTAVLTWTYENGPADTGSGPASIVLGGPELSVTVSLANDTEIPGDLLTTDPTLHAVFHADHDEFDATLYIDVNGDGLADASLFRSGSRPWDSTDPIVVTGDLDLVTYVASGPVNLDIWAEFNWSDSDYVSYTYTYTYYDEYGYAYDYEVENGWYEYDYGYDYAAGALGFDFIDADGHNTGDDCDWQSDGVTHLLDGGPVLTVHWSLASDTGTPGDKITTDPDLRVVVWTSGNSAFHADLFIDLDGDGIEDVTASVSSDPNLYGTWPYAGVGIDLSPYVGHGLIEASVWADMEYSYEYEYIYDYYDEYYQYEYDQYGYGYWTGQWIQQVTTEDRLVQLESAGGTFHFMYTDQECYATPDPIERREHYTYDNNGRLHTYTDVLGRTTTYGYDELGRPTTTTDLNGITTTGYDPFGRVASVTLPDPDTIGGPNGPVMTYAYDLLDRNISVTDPLGGQQRFEYDGLGRLVHQYDELDRVTSFGYDPLGRLTSTVDGYGNSTDYGYDVMDRQTSITNRLGHATSIGYDNLGRVTTQTDAETGVVAYAYDAAGNLHSLTDPVGNVTTFVYDHLDRQTAEWIVSDDDAVLSRLFEYDPAGNLTRRTDRNGRVREFDWTFAFDSAAGYRFDSERWINPDGSLNRTIAAEYDDQYGLLLTRMSDPDAVYEYTYDTRGRIDTINSMIPVNDSSGPHGPGETGILALLDYDYDLLNRRTQLAASHGTVVVATGQELGSTTADFVNNWQYDGLHRVTRVTQTDGSPSDSLPISDKRIDLSYTPDSRFNVIDRYADLNGTQPVASSTYSYDSTVGWLTGLTHSAPGSGDPAFPITYSWQYDDSGRITQFASPDGTATYSYDGTDQLTGVDNTANPDESYTYDLNGNRISTGYQTGVNNRLLSDGTFDYEYDNEGNRTRRTNIATGEYVEYEWDHRNRLISVTFHDAANAITREVEYRYDAFNRRIVKSVTEGGTTTNEHFVYDDRPNSDLDDVVLVFDGFDVAERHLHGPAIDQFFSQEDQYGDVVWGLADNQGTIRDVASHDAANGTTVVDHIEYDAFGNITSGPLNSDVTYAYTGREWDADAELYYYRARWYDPAAGRFASEDPLGFAAGDANLSAMVSNSVPNFVDPSGKLSAKITTTTVGGKTYVYQTLYEPVVFGIAHHVIQNILIGEMNTETGLVSRKINGGQTVGKTLKDIRSFGEGYSNVRFTTIDQWDTWFTRNEHGTAMDPNSLSPEVRTANLGALGPMLGLLAGHVVRGLIREVACRTGPGAAIRVVRGVRGSLIIRQAGRTVKTLTAKTIERLKNKFNLKGKGATLDDIAQAIENEGNKGICAPKSAWARISSDTLRGRGRRAYEAAYGRVVERAQRIAARTGVNPLEVHHRIPLEYRHLFDADPNRLSNLIGLHKNVHAEISGLWTSFRLANPNATRTQILDFAKRIDTEYGRFFNTLDTNGSMPSFK